MVTTYVIPHGTSNSFSFLVDKCGTIGSTSKAQGEFQVAETSNCFPLTPLINSYVEIISLTKEVTGSDKMYASMGRQTITYQQVTQCTSHIINELNSGEFCHL